MIFGLVLPAFQVCETFYRNSSFVCPSGPWYCHERGRGSVSNLVPPRADLAVSQTHSHLGQWVKVRFGEERDCKSLNQFFYYLHPCVVVELLVVNCLERRMFVVDLKTFHPQLQN